MPASTTGKGLQHGWTLGENGWKAGMDENVLRLDAMAHEQWAQNRATTAGLTSTTPVINTSDATNPIVPGNPTLASPVSRKHTASAGECSYSPRYSVSDKRPNRASSARSVSPSPPSDSPTDNHSASAPVSPIVVCASSPTRISDA